MQLDFVSTKGQISSMLLTEKVSTSVRYTWISSADVFT